MTTSHAPKVETGTLYNQLASRISDLIDRGTLRPGEKVPSVRRISECDDVSISTVVQAYRLLESQGRIEARPKSGYYVRARRYVPPPEPTPTQPISRSTRVDINNLVMRVLDSLRTPGLINLGAACPCPELMPGAELNRRMAAIGRRIPGHGNRYSLPPGPIELRTQIARRSLEAGCSLAPDEIISTNGAVEAISLALRAVAKPGDTIAIESPTYFGFLQTIEALGMKACEIATHPRDGVCLEALQEQLKQRRVVACLFSLNYSNPLGSLMPDECKQQLVEMLADFEIPLIEDDIYGELGFAEKRPRMAKAFDRQGLVLVCSSFSKTIAPGYRVGWVVPGKYYSVVKHLKCVTSGADFPLPQLAVAEYVANGGYEHHLRKVRRIYHQNLALMTQFIAQHFPKGTRVSRPAGGHVLWLELPEGADSLQLLDRALAHGISLAPGPLFSPSRKFTQFIRLNAGNEWDGRVERALAQLGKLAAEQMG